MLFVDALRRGAVTICSRIGSDASAKPGGWRSRRGEDAAALAASETRLRLATTATGMGTWELDLRTDEVVVSEMLATLLGLPSGVTRFPLAAARGLVPAEDRARIAEADRAAAEEDQPFASLVRVAAPEGGVRWVASRGEVAGRDPDGTARRMVGVTWDVTDQKITHDALQRSERNLAEAQALTQIGSWEWEVAEDRVSWSAELHRIFGLTPEQAPASFQAYLALVDAADRARVDDLIRAAVVDLAPFQFTHRLVRPDGEERVLEARGRAVLDEQGRLIRLQGTDQDITARTVIEQELEAQRLFLHAVLDGIEDGIVACDAAGVLTLFNRATRALHGLDQAATPEAEWATRYSLYRPDGVTPLPTEEIPLVRALRDGAVRDAEIVIAPPDGPRRTVICRGQALVDAAGRRLGAVAHMRDVTERKALEAQLRHQAFHDALTGLPNRALLFDRLSHALVRSARRGTRAAVLFLDLDDFKVVNDSCGHAGGDEALAEVARRLRLALRDDDTVARFAGDEFVCLLEDLSADDAIERASAAVARIAERLRAPIALSGGREAAVSASVGIALSSPETDDAGAVLRQADQAMYAAKRAGAGLARFFEPSMNERAEARLTRLTELRRAIEAAQLTLRYQPIIDLANGELRGVEALVRWRHPTRGLLGPDAFIPIAEETELIRLLDRWVLEEACREVATWGADALFVSVNLSARQVEHTELVREVAEVLARVGLAPSRLRLEITERVALGGDDAIARLAALKALGVGLAIDDFGTGYSGLSILKRAPVDVVKIDRSFIAGLGVDERDAAIVQSIAALARALGLETTAEGVETEAQASLVRRLGCAHGQGFLFGRPMTAAALLARIARGAAPSAAARTTSARLGNAVRGSPRRGLSP